MPTDMYKVSLSCAVTLLSEDSITSRHPVSVADYMYMYTVYIVCMYDTYMCCPICVHL